MNSLTKNIVAIIFLLSLYFPKAIAQRNTVDKLLKLLSTAKDDTARFSAYNDLVEAYKNVNLDSGVYYAQQQILISKKINDPPMSETALNQYGYALFSAGNYPDALAVLYEALQQSEANADTPEVATSCLQLGFVYRNSDEYRKAIDYFNKYKLIADYHNDDNMRMTFYTDAGRAYEQLNILDSALLYGQQAYGLILRLKPGFGTGGILCNLGTVQSKLGNNNLAINTFRQSIEQSLNHEDFRTLARCYNEIAKHFYKNKQADSAIYYSKEALKINTQHSFTVQTLDAGTLLTGIFKNENKYDSAFKYQQITLAAKDSLFSREKINRMQNQEFNYQLYRQEIKIQQEQLRNKLRTYLLLAGLLVFLLLATILWRNNRNKQKAKIKIEKAYEELKSTQAQLIQREKMASLGELTAGIAHEIQNPLNFVNNFSEVNKELLVELKVEIDKGNIDEVKAIANDVIDNEEKINRHGKRADAIVKGMLQHSQASAGQIESIDINELADEYLRLSYQGFRAKDKTFSATLQRDFDKSLSAGQAGVGKVNIIPKDIGRVLLNLFNNAFYAVAEKKKTLQPPPVGGGVIYEPTVTVSTKAFKPSPTGGGLGVEISVRDNGSGIPQKVLDKIFQPFFTTKPTGQGTGLGLSLAYDIIKAHGGELKVSTKEGEGTTFIFSLTVST